jgi:ribose 5-phosphate isomerase
VVTDNGNFIIDAPFEREHMLDPFVASEVPAVWTLAY